LQDLAMKILTLSNLYPPHYLGGYELACHDVACSLARRGHQVQILTSTYGVPAPCREGNVARLLDRAYPPDALWRRERARSRHNVAVLSAEVAGFRPDLVHVFNPSGLSGAVLTWLHHACPCPVVHDISDLWLPNAYAEDTWARFADRTPRPLRRLWARLVGPATGGAMDFSKSYYRSDFLRVWHRGHGLDPRSAGVIHHGVAQAELPKWSPEGRGVVFAGRLSADKGVHILLQAVRSLADRRPDLSFPVTLSGSGDDAYVDGLREIARALPERVPVRFAGALPRGESLRAVAEHMLYAFPVVWDEPFSIGLVEALAAGMPLVATRTGGTPEIVEHGRNGLLVERSDPQAFSAGLERLLDDAALRMRFSEGARASVAHLEFERTVDRVEEHLRGVLAS
jgi:glycosyltransferase involved in cell wall biosynthesis